MLSVFTQHIVNTYTLIITCSFILTILHNTQNHLYNRWEELMRGRIIEGPEIGNSFETTSPVKFIGCGGGGFMIWFWKMLYWIFNTKFFRYESYLTPCYYIVYLYIELQQGTRVWSHVYYIIVVVVSVIT